MDQVEVSLRKQISKETIALQNLLDANMWDLKDTGNAIRRVKMIHAARRVLGIPPPVEISDDVEAKIDQLSAGEISDDLYDFLLHSRQLHSAFKELLKASELALASNNVAVVPETSIEFARSVLDSGDVEV